MAILMEFQTKNFWAWPSFYAPHPHLASYKPKSKNLGFSTFWLLLLELANQRKEGTNQLFIVYVTSFILNSFSFLSIPHVGCKTPSLSKMYVLSKVCLISEIGRVCFHLESLDYDHFPLIFSIFLIFSSYESYFHYIIKDFFIFKRILEAFNPFITFSPYTFLFRQSCTLS